jgi:hypothetical protein
MFRIDQILNATTFIRSFREVADRLSRNPEPLLITQKNGRFIVVMDGEFFEGLLEGMASFNPQGSGLEAGVPMISNHKVS